MILLNKNFKDKLDAGAIPLVKAYITSDATRRVYGKVLPELDAESETRLWDGSWEVGEGDFGGERDVTEVGARVVSFGSQTVTIAPNTKDLLLSLQQTEIGSFSIKLDNTKGYFSNIMSGELVESFLQNTLEIKIGFPGLDPDDEISFFKGNIVNETVSSKTLTLTAEGTTPSLWETFELPKSGRYTNPENQNDILVIPYGDLTENAGSAGLWNCPQIDTISDVYGISGRTIQETGDGNTITLYDDDGAISSGDYTITNGDYESTGIEITYATFSTPPTGNVLCKAKGRANSGGTLLTNPIDILTDILSIAGDQTLKDTTSWNTATNNANAYSWTCAGILTADNSLNYWMTDLLSTFLGSWYLNNENKIVVGLDTPGQNIQNVAGSLKQEKGVNISAFRARNNVTNQVIANYAPSYASQDKRYKEDILINFQQTDEGEDYIDTGSVNIYGARKKTYDLNWTRNTATVNSIQERIIDKYKSPVFLTTFMENSFRNLAVEAGDYVLYSWEYLKDEEGDSLQNQIGRVLSVTRNYDNMSMQFQLYDTGLFWETGFRYWDGSWTVGTGTFGGVRDRRNL